MKIFKAVPTFFLCLSLFGATAIAAEKKKAGSAPKSSDKKAAAKKTDAKPEADKTAPDKAGTEKSAGTDPTAAGDVAAKINGKPIPMSELEAALNQAAKGKGASPDSLPPEQKNMIMHRLLDQMIEDKLVEEASAKIEVTEEDVKTEYDRILKQAGGTEEALVKQLSNIGLDLATFKTDMKKRIRQRRWVEEQIKDKAPDATEAQAKEFYEKNADRFATQEMVRASHILLKLETGEKEEKVKEVSAKANAILDRAKKGEDFEKLALELSEDPTVKENKGDLNFFPREGSMVEPFAEEAFKMKKGDLSDMPLRTQFGLHIIKVTDRKEAGKMPFEEAKEKITNFLSRQGKGDAVQGLISDLRNKAKIEIILPKMEQPAPPQGGPGGPGGPENESAPPAPAPAPAGKDGAAATPPVEIATPPVAAPAN